MQDTATAKNSYSASNIKVLEGLDAVRKRPGMYIGNVEADGYHQLLYEVIDNAVDESFEGTCNTITVEIHDDGSASVEDNGRGIPVELHEDSGFPTAEVVLTKLHAGAKFDSDAYKFSGGLHGVGLSVVNALSAWVEVIISRDRKKHQLIFKHSIPEVTQNGTSVIPIGPTSTTGTYVRFKPELSFFHVDKFNKLRIQKRLEELSYLVPGVNFHLKIDGEQHTYYSEHGIKSLLHKLTGDKLRTEPICLSLSGSEKRENSEVFDADFHLALGFQSGSLSETIVSFANGIRTSDGGTHVSTFRTAFSRALRLFAKDRNVKATSEVIEEVRQELYGVIEVKVSDPLFESQTKVKLKNFEFQRLFLKDLISALREAFTFQEEIFEKLLSEASEIARRKQRLKSDIQKLKTKLARQQQSLPIKLSDCSTKKFDSRELFIVEGDSAGGSLKQCKDDKTQAVLPLRGKTLNTERASFETQVSKNDSLLSIISALGLSFDESNSSRLRYSRIIIMTDADADGGHITILLLSFFYKYFPELFADGRIFIAVPPLYRVVFKKETQYCVNDAALDTYLKSLSAAKRKQAVIQRFKGLGEMNPEQLWETCINPKTRNLQKVELRDVDRVKAVLQQTLGDSAEERKQFIRDHAARVDETFLFEM